MRRNRFSVAAVLSLSLLMGGCATWSVANVDGQPPDATKHAGKTALADIRMVEGDITDRAYTPVGDISATVNKTTVFHANPTPELVAEKLRAEAFRLGADAVIFITYGKVGVSMMSWGSLEGKGRAVRFSD
jgi:uncharacterized protein YbjQ (UPF0145 family)